ncbi:hypothetical protein ACFLQ2_02090 [archaeon]
MKSLNIKKAAAVAAGTALLVGAALAALPTKDFYWDASGNTNVQIVVGGDAMISDGIAAAKLAAVIGNKAYIEAGGSVTPDAMGTVKLKISGSSAVPTEGTYMDKTEAGGTITETVNTLTLGEAHGMHKGTFTFQNAEYDYKESVSVSNAVNLKYEEDKDFHGVYLEGTGSKRIKYTLDFIKNFPYSDSKLNQTVEIKFLGSNYVINKITANEVHLVKGEKVSLGIGQSSDVVISDNTYTVTLDSASLDETTTPNTGYATVTVTGGDLTSAVTTQLDTGNNQDATTSGFYTYLQSVQKSYTPGQGGSATLRVGGELLKLVDNDKFPGSDIWKVDITNVAPNTDKIDVYLNKNYAKNDQMTAITGPKDYFTINYAGTNADRGEIEVDTFTLHGTESSERYVIDEVTYSDTYENQYTFEMWDDTDYRTNAFLANTTDGAIVQNSNFSNITAIEPGYLPLKAGDFFFLNEQPLRLESVYYKSGDLDNSYVKLKTPGAASAIEYSFTGHRNVTQANQVGDLQMVANWPNATYGPWYLGFNNASAATSNIILSAATGISVSTNQGSQTVQFALTSGDFMSYGTDDVVYVISGADNNVSSDYYNLTWTNPVWNWTNGSGTTTGMSHGYAYENNTALSANFKLATGRPGHTYTYAKSANYEGIKATDAAVATTYVDQNQEKASEDRYTYHELGYANLEATDANTLEVKAFKEDAKLRVTLVPGVSETESVSENAFTVTTDKTFPYDVTSDVIVSDLTCDVDAVATGVTFGTVSGSLVVSDSTNPTGNAIVIGGHYVNNLAVGKTEALTSAGAKMTELDGSTLYVAGYTASDTAAEVDSLIAAIKAL